MKKIIKIEDTYEVEINDCDNMSEEEINQTALDVVKVIKRKEVRDIFEPISSFKTFKFLEKTAHGLEVVKAFEDLKDHRMHVIVHRPSDDTYIVGLGYSPDDGIWNQGRYDFRSFEKAKEALDKEYTVKEFVKEEVGDIKVEDKPSNSPEETISITYNERLPKGKEALTYSMIETAFKNRDKDEGKTFKVYVDEVLKSLHNDIENAEHLVSGEMKSTRKLLLEDYVKIEKLIEKAGLEDKLAEMKPLVDELSDKLKLNYWKKPKFRASNVTQASNELRSKHRYDSKIVKKIEPIFLCTQEELKKSYNDAKEGKLPEVFEANLEKVRKDMAADYDRIMQGRDTYVEDPRISTTLPKIIELYDYALKCADDLEYSEYAREFAFMLDTIKKHWGLAGE